MIHLMVDSTAVTNMFVQDPSTMEGEGRNLPSRLLFSSRAFSLDRDSLQASFLSGLQKGF